jgi:hypothetical protein
MFNADEKWAHGETEDAKNITSCLWHLYQNAAKHLCDHPEFLKVLKKCVYEDRLVAHFDMKWHDLLVQYNLCDFFWITNMYSLHPKINVSSFARYIFN